MLVILVYRMSVQLTGADRAVHNLIAKGLQEVLPVNLFLAEEGKTIPYTERSSWQRLWLVDSLAGTAEFIKRIDRFTVNIAMIDGGLDKAGVVYVPAQD